MLPEHLLLYLNDQIRCREQQIEQLTALLDPEVPCLPALVLHGQEATGKTLTITQTLSSLSVPHAIIKSRECITGRHLLERTILTVKSTLEAADHGPFPHIDGRCENLNVLSVYLSQLLTSVPKFILVFDGIDRQREAPPTLLPALARLGEIIPSLTTVFITTHPRPRFLSLAGVPHVSFPPYTRTQTLEILSQHPLPIFASETLDEASEQHRHECEEDDSWLWPRFCGAVYDSFGRTTTRAVPALRALCETLWPRFVEHIRSGAYGTRDFSRLMVRTRPLFQSEDVLRANLLSPPTGAVAGVGAAVASRKAQDTLSYYSKFLLIAAYLASHNPPRTDQTFFSKSSEASKKRKKKGGAPAGSGPGRPQKQRKVARKLLGAQPFVLERWLAIFHAIVPHGIPAGSADLLTQVASLAGLRMVVRLGTGTDVVDAGAKWKVNVGWEYVKVVAKGLRFEIEDHVAE